jgi:hypothetical protein
VNKNILTTPSADQLGHSPKRLDREGLDKEDPQGEIQVEEQLGFHEGKLNEHLREQQQEGAYPSPD